jgi:phage/plasmid primase-like uncharacterized protein
MPETSLDFASSARLLKSKVTLRQVIESYGIELKGRHICCPLHHENTPSFKVYEEDTEDGNFYCFGCQKHGDLISFVVFMDSITAGQAITKIARNFHVELVTKENLKNTLLENLSLVLKHKPKPVDEEVENIVHWSVLAQKVQKELGTMGTEVVPYLCTKNLPHVETMSKFNCLIVPMKDIDDEIWSFQQIFPDGGKKFLEGGRKKGLMLRLGPVSDKFVFIAEGWATGASVFISTGVTTYVAFNASNIDSVASQLKDKYPGISVRVAGDNDEPGRMHHQPATYPADYKTDWSDVYMKYGKERVKNLLLKL